jgi:hypothetical protein
MFAIYSDCNRVKLCCTVFECCDEMFSKTMSVPDGPSKSFQTIFKLQEIARESLNGNRKILSWFTRGAVSRDRGGPACWGLLANTNS